MTNSSDPGFDPAHPPGTTAPHTGIYKCQGCGREVISNIDDPLPPQNHHQHGLEQGAIAWRLIVAAA
ncbi:MAG: protein L [Verrucomicrobiota bacterium]|nr:protein L [Verrucomicrobiota bacterium]